MDEQKSPTKDRVSTVYIAGTVVVLLILLIGVSLIYAAFYKKPNNTNNTKASENTNAQVTETPTMTVTPSVTETVNLEFVNSEVQNGLKDRYTDKDCHALVDDEKLWSKQLNNLYLSVFVVPKSGVKTKAALDAYNAELTYLSGGQAPSTNGGSAPAIFISYCVGGGAASFIKEIPVTYPHADAARAQVFVGENQSAEDTVSYMSITIHVAAKKGDKIFMLTKVYSQLDKFISDAEVQACKRKTPGANDFYYLDQACVAGIIANKDASMQKISEETADLVSYFAIK